jgi:SAM-dependent methyltransferase
MKKQLLIGSGPDRTKKVVADGESLDWEDLTTLDLDPDCGADVIWDLENFPYPFMDNTFDEIHAYEILEHLGSQGDYKFFFKQFEEFWRILKPNGIFVGLVPGPKSPWVWGDPGHRRVITPEQLLFLDRNQYGKDENGKLKFVQSDYYSKIYHANFKTVSKSFDEKYYSFFFMLKAIK